MQVILIAIVQNAMGVKMEIRAKSEARIIADFNRGRISAKQASKMLARVAIRKTRKTRKTEKWS